MNFWILHPSIFAYLEQKFQHFLVQNGTSKKAEFYLPQAINELIQDAEVAVVAHVSTDSWFGMTYPADKEKVQHELKIQIQNKQYPEKLWQ